LGGCDREDYGSRPAPANNLQDPYFQNNQSKMDWRCGSRGRAPALQTQSPDFKTQTHQKKVSVRYKLDLKDSEYKKEEESIHPIYLSTHKI
jgi:hypothetical protein